VEVLRNFVTGRSADSVSGVVDPGTGERSAQAPVFGPHDVGAAMRVAATPLESWRDTSVGRDAAACVGFRCFAVNYYLMANT
jgi:hypothetical protein